MDWRSRSPLFYLLIANKYQKCLPYITNLMCNNINTNEDDFSKLPLAHFPRPQLALVIAENLISYL